MMKRDFEIHDINMDTDSLQDEIKSRGHYTQSWSSREEKEVKAEDQHEEGEDGDEHGDKNIDHQELQHCVMLGDMVNRNSETDITKYYHLEVEQHQVRGHCVYDTNNCGSSLEGQSLLRNGRGQKKVSGKSSLKKELEKSMRHMAKGPPLIPRCVHQSTKNNTENGYNCNTLTTQDYEKFHRDFYYTPSKIAQDTFLLNYCVAQIPRRGMKRKTQTICYYVPKCGTVENSLPLVKVCQKVFTTLLGISKERIQRVCRQHMNTLSLPKERRGGDRKSELYSDRLESIKLYIKGLKHPELFYVRGQANTRHPKNVLNIRKLHNCYNAEHDKPVTYEYFRTIYNKYFKPFTTDTETTM